MELHKLLKPGKESGCLERIRNEKIRRKELIRIDLDGLAGDCRRATDRWGGGRWRVGNGVGEGGGCGSGRLGNGVGRWEGGGWGMGWVGDKWLRGQYKKILKQQVSDQDESQTGNRERRRTNK